MYPRSGMAYVSLQTARHRARAVDAAREGTHEARAATFSETYADEIAAWRRAGIVVAVIAGVLLAVAWIA